MNSYHFVLNNVTNNSRVLKTTQSLIKYHLVDKVYIVGIWQKNLKEEEWIDDNRCILRIKTPLQNQFAKGNFKHRSLLRQFIAFFSVYFFYLKIFRIQTLNKTDFVSCHHVKLLPILSLLVFFRKATLIYTPHELECEKKGISPAEKFFARINEKLFIHLPSKVVVVSEPIREWYKQEYNLKNIFVLPNIPINISNKIFATNSLLKEKFGLSPNNILFIYQGLLSAGRDLDELIEVFTQYADKHLVLMGYGSKVEQIKLLEKKYSNIHFHEAVPLNEIIKYTSGADIGLFFLFNKPSLSYQYSLPNKFSEYIIAGLPVVVSTHTSYLSNLITQNGCGWSLVPSKDALTSFIQSVNIEDINKLKPAISRYSNNLGWQFEDSILKKIYIK